MRRPVALAVLLSAWGYLALAVGLAVVQHVAGDRWWPATVLIFGPRWIWIVPAVPVVVGAIRAREALILQKIQPVWAALAAAAVVVLGVMDFNVPLRHAVSGGPRGDALRVVTVNAGSKTDTIGRLHEAVPGLAPDVLCVEECSGEEFRRLWPPENVFVERGLCLASRYPFHDPTLLYDQALGGNGVVARFDVDAPRGRFRLVIVHLETPRDGLDEFRHRGWKAAPTLEAQSAVRQREAEAVRAWMGRAGPTIVAGDFNTPDESRIFASAWDGLENAFSVAGWGFGYTKRTRLIRVRIDHVLATEHFDVAASFVGPDIGSDHLPVIADLRWR